jgi:hypothetical protein
MNKAGPSIPLFEMIARASPVPYYGPNVGRTFGLQDAFTLEWRYRRLEADDPLTGHWTE